VRNIPEKHADWVKSNCAYIRYYGWKKEIVKCYEYYERALNNTIFHLQQAHPLSILVHNTLGYELLNNNADPSKCEKIFQKSFEVSEQALGYMHTTSGKILLQLAELPLPLEKTINFMLQALIILENTKTDKAMVINASKKVSAIYSKMNNFGKMIHFSRKSEDWANEIVGLEKLHDYKMVLQLSTRPATNTQELKFLIEKSFIAYVRLLSFSSFFNLYKLFIALVEHLPKYEQACFNIQRKLSV
jgi:hypothetical protein